MSFEFILTTDEIRERMFNFLKPLYKGTYDSEVQNIDWIYGVYDKENGIFVTFIYKYKYIVITDKGDIFNIMKDRYNKDFFDIPEQFSGLSDIIKEGIKIYSDDTLRKDFQKNLSDEQKRRIIEIRKNMDDRCKPCVVIQDENDAKCLFYECNCNYKYIQIRYNKKSVEDFDKFVSEEKMYLWRGEKYVNLINRISEYKSPLSEEQYKQISAYALSAGLIFERGTDDTYEELTFKAIKNAYFRGVKSCGYTDLIERYINKYIKTYPERIKNLSPLLDFLDTYCSGEEFKDLEFLRKELSRLIYNRVYGFNFILMTDEIREKMFDFLKPEYRHHHDLDVYNINWKYGVYDKESGIFLTLIYYVSDFIARCGTDYYSYIVITDKGDTFKVDNNDSREGWEFSIPEDYSYLSDKVKEGIKFYENHFDFTESLSEETKKEFKKIEEIMYDRCCKNFLINCEDDAKELFESNDFNENRIYEIYNEKTVENFNKYATVENISCWRQEEYNKILTELFEYYDKYRDEKDYNYRQTMEYFQRSFRKINNLIWFGIKNINMVLLCDVVKIIDDNTPFFHFTVWDVFNIQRYAEYYLGNNPDGKQNIMPLINWVEERRLDKFLYTDLKKLLDKYDS